MIEIDLQELTNLLEELVPEWLPLAMLLLNYTDVQIIRKEFTQTDPRLALAEVLDRWIKSVDTATWSYLVAAITRLRGHNKLAKRIATQHGCAGVIDICLIQVHVHACIIYNVYNDFHFV